MYGWHRLLPFREYPDHWGMFMWYNLGGGQFWRRPLHDLRRRSSSRRWWWRSSSRRRSISRRWWW
jgi:hypothetical protein